MVAHETSLKNDIQKLSSNIKDLNSDKKQKKLSKRNRQIPLYKKFRHHISPFSNEEQLYIKIKLNLFALKKKLITDPVTCVKDSMMLSVVWASVSVLGMISFAGVIGGRLFQKCKHVPEKKSTKSTTPLIQPKVTLSIIIPTYNAADSIVPVLLALYKGIETSGISAEIIIVDAGSCDSTCDIVQSVHDSWQANGLLAGIEQGKTGLEGIKLCHYTGETEVGLMLHQGYLKSSGSLMMFSAQDLILPDDYPSLIHQALSTCTRNKLDRYQDIEIGCFMMDTDPPMDTHWMKPLLMFLNFKTYYLSVPSIENALFMKTQTYMRVGELHSLADRKETPREVENANQKTNTITLLLREHYQGHLVIVDTPVKLYGLRWFMNPILCYKNIKKTCIDYEELRLIHVIKSFFQEHIAYIWSIFSSK